MTGYDKQRLDDWMMGAILTKALPKNILVEIKAGNEESYKTIVFKPMLESDPKESKMFITDNNWNIMNYICPGNV